MMRRSFIVAAAAFGVVAVALASLLPADRPLSEALAGIDPGILPRLQMFELARLGGWAWQRVTVPLLIRPAWLLPFAVALVCGGMAATLRADEVRRGSRSR